MIHVPDVSATVDWYRSIGFNVRNTNVKEGEMNWAALTYGEGEFMLNAAGRPSAADGREVDLYISTTRIDDLYAALKDRVDVIEPLHNTFYGMREFIIRDCNRFWLTFGEPV
jgi:uncharacterized glyoxalase superfamily protein PhnB